MNDGSGAALPSDAVHGDRLDEDQIALVLRRATELDGQAHAGQAGLDLVRLEEAAVEAGLSRQSVRRAVAELRAGALGVDSRGETRRSGLGPTTLTVSRCVPGPARVVDDILRRFLQREQFHLRRDFGNNSSWDRRQDMRAKVRVSLDKSVHRRLVLREIEHAEIAVVEEPGSDGGVVMVKLAVDARPLRRAHRVAVGRGAAVGVVATLGGLAMFGAVDALILLPVATGSGVAVGHVVGSSRCRSGVDDLETALEGYLDGLERRPH
ncbi:MAG: hypothetical protein M3066_01380 [Actinomycetota bacterium]|nr:hypothetical protein [Actinomycetota bacterium]